MIFHFQTGTVTFFEEDQNYFEQKFMHLKKMLGSIAGIDDDTIDVRIKLEKNKHHAGDRFEASSTVTSPHHGKFHSDVSAESIKACADLMHDKLKAQITKFHDKTVNKK